MDEKEARREQNKEYAPRQVEHAASLDEIEQGSLMDFSGKICNVGIVNRFSSNKPYLLAEALKSRGFEVELLNLSDMSIRDSTVFHGDKAVDVDVVISRLSENIYRGTADLFLALESQGILLWNPSSVLGVCADKLETQELLSAADVPVVPTKPVFPGHVVMNQEVVKPRIGAGGRDVLFSGQVPLTTIESWVSQPYVGSPESFRRVLTVGSDIIAVYERIPQPGIQVNNIDKGGTRRFLTVDDEVRKIVNQILNVLSDSAVLGIDLTSDFSVLEVNGAPGIPDVCLDQVADKLSDKLNSL